MSFTPWRETAFLSHTLTAPRSSKDNNSSSSPPVNMGTSITCSKSIINDESAQNNSKNSKIGKTCQDVTDTYETFDKRFILKTMQKQCSVEFLRKHLLTGSEDLVLKKRNKASILAAYAEWRNEKNVSKSEESVVAKECTARDSVYSNNNSSSSSNSSSSNISSSSSSSSSSSRLEDTFTVLYNRSRSISTQCSRTSVLLLHEDYPEELPIFSSSNSNSKKYRENGSLNKEVHVVGSSDIMVRSSNDSHRVVCVLGAVRDASDVEVGAAIQGTVYHIEHVFVCVCVCVCVCVWKYVCTCVIVYVCGWIHASICRYFCICGVYACVGFVICRGV